MKTNAKLGAMAVGRRALENNEGYELGESQSPYNRVFDTKKGGLRKSQPLDLHQDAFSLKVSHKRLKKCKYVTDVPLFLRESHGN